MTRIRYLIHDSREARENEIRERFEKAGVLPAAAIQCRDGILLVSISKKSKTQKIFRVLERVAFVGVGEPTDFTRLYQVLSADAKTLAIMKMSKGDMRVVDHIRDRAQHYVRDLFRDLHNSAYLECEIIIAQVGRTPLEDRMWGIDLTGLVMPLGQEHSLCVPCETEEGRAGLHIKFDHIPTMQDALRKFYQTIQDQYPADGDPVSRIEVAILSRQRVIAKDFQRVYQKLSSEEIRRMLQA